MENTFIYLFLIIAISLLIYLVVILFNKRFNTTPKTVHPSVLYKKVEDGYSILVDFLYHGQNKKEFKQDIKKMILKRADGRYFGGYSNNTNEFNWTSFSLDLFYDLLNYDQRKGIDFIFDLEKEVSLEKLNAFFKQLLKENISLNYESTKEQFPYYNILLAYQKEFNKNGIQLAYFTDNSESNYLFIFSLEKEKMIKKAIFNIGFEYQASFIKKEEFVKRKMALI